MQMRQSDRFPTTRAGFQERHGLHLGKTTTFEVVAYLFRVSMLGGTIPTPLYPIYAARLGLTPLLITVIFAVYAAGTLTSLLLFGRLSDQVGRHPVLGTAVGLAAASTVVFIVWPTLPGLFIGRVLSGLSVGLVTGTATAYLTELHHNRARAALVATLANMGGLGLGPLLAGLLAEFVPHPLLVPYLVLLVLLIPAVAVVFAYPTVTRSKTVKLRPQALAIPAEIRGTFLVAAAAAFAAFALLGLVSALIGNFLTSGLGIHNYALAGAVTFALFASAALAQVAAMRMSHRSAVLVGTALLPAGLALLVAALPVHSLALLLAGIIVGGLGVGLAFRAGLTLVSELAPAGERGDVVSSLFVAAYTGMALPVVGIGVLLTFLPLQTSATIFAVIVAGIAAAARVIGARSPQLSGHTCRCPGASAHG